MENLFCKRSDLVTESDVEQKLLWRLLTEASPRGLGYEPSEVFTKPNLKRLAIGKGDSQKLYYPDYIVIVAGVPLMAIEAKSPKEDPKQGVAEARLYAGRLNEMFPSGLNPCEWVASCNGDALVVTRWDSTDIEFEIPFGQLSLVDQLYADFVDKVGASTLRQRIDPIRRRQRGPELRRAVSEVGGESVRNEEIGHNTFGSSLALDYRRLFNPSSPADRAYVVRNAYVPSKRRERFVEPIDKLIRQIAQPGVGHLHVVEDTANPREIVRSLETRHKGSSLERQVMLLVGSRGAGKSTFVDYLVNVALPTQLVEETVWLRVNLNVAPLGDMQSWLVEQLIRELHAADQGTDFDSLETILKVYSVEVGRLKKGPLKLLKAGSELYNQKLSELLLELQNDRVATLNALARFLCSQRGRLLIVVMDNCDKRTRDEQLQAFQLAQWVQSHLHCLTVLPLRDVTYDTCRNDPPLDTAQKDLVFRIEPPQFTKVLQARVRLILRELEKRPGEHLEYTLENGIRVRYPASDQGMYLACILKSLFEHDQFLRRLLVGLSGRDMRRAMEIFLEFCQSGYIAESEVFKIRQFRGDYALPLHVVAAVLLRVDRRFYDGDVSYIKNLFQADPDSAYPDHFARLGILRQVASLRQEMGPSGVVGYHTVSTVLKALTCVGHESRRVRDELRFLLRAGCIVAEHQRTDTLADRDLIAIAPSGVVHLEMLSSVDYLAAVAEDTWIADPDMVTRVRARAGLSRMNHLSEPTILANASDLVEYLQVQQSAWPSEFEGILDGGSIGMLHDIDDAARAIERTRRAQRNAAKRGRVYVGNLPFGVTEDAVAAVFTDVGLRVLDVFLPQNDFGKQLGYAFVALGSDEVARAAIRKLEGATIGGRMIRVNPANERR